MTAPGALTAEDVAAARVETAAGRPVTVWFTAAAVGVPTGGSAKVLSVGEAVEGDFIQVRPVGSTDTMYCAPAELTRVRPPRRRAAPVAEPARPRAGTSAPARPTEEAPAGSPRAGTQRAGTPRAGTPRAGTQRAGTPRAGTPRAGTQRAGTPRSASARSGSRRAGAAVEVPAPAQPDASGPAAAPPPAPAAGGAERAASPAAAHPPAEPPARTAAPRRRMPRTGEITVSLAANADGEWTVEVLAGTKRVVARTPVQPTDVAAAARSLPPAVAEVVAASLEGARQRQRDRVEQLRAELHAAQQALEQLGAGG
jgi:hypothetical protein